MAQPLDPYRTLGLPPGASLDEVRRAYRRLAKANHPDSAGEAALPRFLAIQAAYEMLTEGQGGRPGPARASRADPTRARAARSAYGRGGASTADPGAGPGAGPGTSARGKADGGSRPPGAGSRPRPDGTAPGSGRGPSDRTRHGGGRTSRNKATLGSTSYDAAEDEPFEPEWSGGTWYGASSGTYWTLNPKEYADPRKHGPEYQRRARRRLDGDEPEDATSFSGDDFQDQESESGTADAGPARFDGRWTYPDEADPRRHEERRDRRSADPAQSPHEQPAWVEESGPRPPLSTLASEAADRALLGRVGIYGRILVAFLGWVPIGALIGWLAGELSGCGRFTATCADPNGLWSVVPQVAVFGLLVLVPSLAAISAAGLVGALLLSGAASVVLSAGGGAHQPEASGAVIMILSLVGYAAGAVLGVARRIGLRRVP